MRSVIILTGGFMGLKDYNSLPDKELVDLLIQNDSGAWDYLLLDVVAPLSRMRKYVEICNRYAISSDSLVTRVWMMLTKDDCRRLRNFRFAASFKTYLFIIVREAQRYEIREKTGKIQFVLSEDNEFCSRIRCKDRSDAPDLVDEMRYTNTLLGKLWQENPRHAWVLLMRNSLNMSAKETAAFLDLKESNVDQMNKRAKHRMSELRKADN